MSTGNKRGRPTERERSVISESVIAVRKALSQTQQDFATTLGTSVTTVARYETNRPPSGTVLIQLSRLASEAGCDGESEAFAQAFMREKGSKKAGMRKGLFEVYSRELNRNAHNIETPINEDERRLVAETLCRYRNREFLPSWTSMDAAAMEDINLLELRSANGEPVNTEREALRDVVAWTRLRRAGPRKPMAPVEIRIEEDTPQQPRSGTLEQEHVSLDRPKPKLCKRARKGTEQ